MVGGRSPAHGAVPVAQPWPPIFLPKAGSPREDRASTSAAPQVTSPGLACGKGSTATMFEAEREEAAPPFSNVSPSDHGGYGDTWCREQDHTHICAPQLDQAQAFSWWGQVSCWGSSSDEARAWAVTHSGLPGAEKLETGLLPLGA